MKDFKKIVRLGTQPEYHRRRDDYSANVFCKIEYVNGELSISGVVGPMSNGDAVGSCGQIIIDNDFTQIKPAPGWNKDMIQQFREVWDKWHLNKLQAGSPAQTKWVQQNIHDKGINYDYTEVCERLTDAGLNPDSDYIHNGAPYKYGHAWLSVDVPTAVLEFLQALPDTDKKPAWV